MKDKPWIFRTYAGHSTATDSNRLFHTNLAKGQTGLSVAFDLPTQTGYDADDPMAKGETGKVGVPIAHLGDMQALFAGIPLARMNTSMTINATAAWLLALYAATADAQGAPRQELAGTTQNDIIKEYLSRGTYVFPPKPSLKLTGHTIAFTAREMPKWNPVNICSYHLQEAGATPVQELAFALSTAIAVLDHLRNAGAITRAEFPQVVGRISFFVNAGIRFVTELCKMRAFAELWDELCRERYGIAEENFRRFRYGVQVNSLGLTEQQPENNVYRILLETLAVTLSKNARARAVQLPAWNEALGLPRPWDQQWALRIQQVMAYETDLLEYGDILDGSPVIEAKTRSLMDGAKTELGRIQEQGGMMAAVEGGYVKRALVESHTQRLRAIERGDITIVGVNKFTETAASPLTAGEGGGILKVDPAAEKEQIARVEAHRKARDGAAVKDALGALEAAARGGDNIMPPSIRCAHAGVTTGEWADVLRRVFGEWRAPTGIESSAKSAGAREKEAELATRVRSTGEALGRPLKLLVGKPGLDGHSNGAEQIAVKARDVGFEVVYDGIRLTPQQIAVAAQEEGVHLVGLSVLSGSHVELVGDVLRELGSRGLGKLPVVVGGIIPPDDETALRAAGVAAVFTPKDADLNRIMAEMIDVTRRANGLPPLGA
jgi:(2R)-ethylmalonyl-CoA mutase